MPKDKNRQSTSGFSASSDPDERFHDFFSTTVTDIPARVTRELEDPEPHGLFERFFAGFNKNKESENASQPIGGETGEIVIGEPEDEPIADLELATTQTQQAKSFFEEPAPARPEPEPAPVQPKPTPAPQKAAVPEPEKPAAPSERAGDLMALLDRASAENAPAAAPAVQAEAPATPEPKSPAAPAAPVAEEIIETAAPAEKAEAAEIAEPAERAETAAPAEAPAPAPTEPGIRFWGVGEDEIPGAPAETAPDADLSLPLVDEPDEPGEPGEAPESPAPTESAEAEPALVPVEDAEAESEAAAAIKTAAPAPETASEAEDEQPLTGPEAIAERLKQMRASLNLRCVLSGVLAAALLYLGLSAEGLVSPVAGLDPVASRGAFYGVNLILLLAAMGVGYTVLRDGLAGLRGRPSSETMPALAAVAALIQALIALINVASYQPSSLTLLSGIAALGLFMALLGSRVMLAAVGGGFELLNSGVEQQGAARARDKDLIRSLSRSLDQKDPWILLSHPLNWQDNLIDRCFDERASERRTRKTAYVLLAVAALSGLLFLCFGAGVNGGAAALAGVLCLGAPLSSTLIAALASLRLSRAAGAVGAMVPGWAAIEELGGIDTVVADAGDLFPAGCAALDDIRIFKGGRIDSDILYAASVLNHSCNTLSALFNQIVADRTDILLPVKDLETHCGLGFSAWCGNNRVLIGTREFMSQQSVPLPDAEYEAAHSQNGEKQVLYLAVSGALHAMFVLHYQGGRHAARGMEVLQRENMRLLVTCQDPSLTARHITAAYHLPEGMVSLLDGEQCAALGASGPESEPCCMVHLKGFASLMGGLRAAEQAQNAETSATTVQIVSVLFSVFIAVLLTSAGSIGSLSVVTVLMYQAAWSALSIAVCALKQHR